MRSPSNIKYKVAKPYTLFNIVKVPSLRFLCNTNIKKHLLVLGIFGTETLLVKDENKNDLVSRF